MTAPSSTFVGSAEQSSIGPTNFNTLPHFLCDHSTSNASFSEHSSASPSPPRFRPAYQTHPDLQFMNHHSQPAVLMDDDDLAEDDTYDGCVSNQIDSKSLPQARPMNDCHKLSISQAARLKVTSAERRATHNAIERARRESLNGRFLQLARALPTMANVKRPSKSVIVNKSLEWICESQMREYHLLRENALLRAQVDELRVQLSLEPLPPNPIMINPSTVSCYPGSCENPSERLSTSPFQAQVEAPPPFGVQPRSNQAAVSSHAHPTRLFCPISTAGPFTVPNNPLFARPNQFEFSATGAASESSDTDRSLGSVTIDSPLTTRPTAHHGSPLGSKTLGDSPNSLLQHFPSSASSDGSEASTSQLNQDLYSLDSLNHLGSRQSEFGVSHQPGLIHFQPLSHLGSYEHSPTVPLVVETNDERFKVITSSSAVAPSKLKSRDSIIVSAGVGEMNLSEKNLINVDNRDRITSQHNQLENRGDPIHGASWVW